jgi:phosphatase NudJ
MARDPIPTHFFALVVVRRADGAFLLVHERKHGQLWYLPAGRVEPLEPLADAARREALEETGVPVILEGVLRVEHTPRPGGARVRVIYLARPADDTPPKSEPDSESLEAAWVSLDRLSEYSLRGPEVERLFREVDAGAPVYPMGLISFEGASLLV